MVLCYYSVMKNNLLRPLNLDFLAFAWRCKCILFVLLSFFSARLEGHHDMNRRGRCTSPFDWAFNLGKTQLYQSSLLFWHVHVIRTFLIKYLQLKTLSCVMIPSEKWSRDFLDLTDGRRCPFWSIDSKCTLKWERKYLVESAHKELTSVIKDIEGSDKSKRVQKLLWTNFIFP